MEALVGEPPIGKTERVIENVEKTLGTVALGLGLHLAAAIVARAIEIETAARTHGRDAIGPLEALAKAIEEARGVVLTVECGARRVRPGAMHRLTPCHLPVGHGGSHESKREDTGAPWSWPQSTPKGL